MGRYILMKSSSASMNSSISFSDNDDGVKATDFSWCFSAVCNAVVTAFLKDQRRLRGGSVSLSVVIFRSLPVACLHQPVYNVPSVSLKTTSAWVS